MGEIHEIITPDTAQDTGISETYPGMPDYWASEIGQFDELLQLARKGKAAASALVGGQGAGKTRLLNRLVKRTRVLGDFALHIHLERFFNYDALLQHLPGRFIRANTPASNPLSSYLESKDPLATFKAASELAAQQQVAVLLAISGWDTLAASSADTSMLHSVIKFVEKLQGINSHLFFLHEFNSPTSPVLDSLSRSGLIHFPLSFPSTSIISELTSELSEGKVSTDEAISATLLKFSGGNLHRINHALRWHFIQPEPADKTLTPETVKQVLRQSGKISAYLQEQVPEAVLQALGQWPASGMIALDDLVWRLQIDGVAGARDQVLQAVVPLQVAGINFQHGTDGNGAFLCFDSLDAQNALSKSENKNEINLYRKLQGQILQARTRMTDASYSSGLEIIKSILDGSQETQDDIFTRQIVTLLLELWHGQYGAVTVAELEAAAQQLVRQPDDKVITALVASLDQVNEETCVIAANALGKIGQDVLPYLCVKIDETGTWGKIWIAHTLAQIPGETSLGLLIGLLEDKDVNVRLAAVAGLEQLGDLEAGEALTFRVLDVEAPVRLAALNALAKLAYAPALGIVAEALADPDESVAAAASDAVVILGGEHAVPALLNCLTDNRERIYQASARALVMFGERARRALMGMLSSEDAEQRLAGVRGLAAFPARQTVPLVVGLLRDEVIEVAEAAVVCLAGFSNEAVEAVARLLLERESVLRERAARTLAAIGEPAVAVLEERLSARRGEVRAAAVMALGEMCRVASADRIIITAKDPDSAVRLAAVKALARIATPDALETVAGAMLDNEASVREAAAWTLGHFGNAAVEPLMAHLLDANDEPVPVVMDALVQIGTGATEALCHALSDKRVNFRAAVLQVLAQNCDPDSAGAVTNCLSDDALYNDACKLLTGIGIEALPALTERLSEPDTILRHRVIEVIARFGEEAIDSISRVLHLDDELARTAGAQTLGEIGSVLAVELLADAIKDDAVSVRVACATALGILGFSECVVPLAQATQDTEANVVQAAVNALAVFGVEAVAEVIKVHTGIDDSAGFRAAQIVEQIGETALSVLPAAINHADSIVRIGAIRIAALLRHEPSVAVIIRSFDDADTAVAQAAEVASITFGVLAAEPLVQVLLMGTPAGSDRALNALVSLDAASVTACIPLLYSDATDACEKGITVLAMLAEHALPALEETIQNADRATVRRAVITTLGRIGKPSVAPALEKALDDTVAEIRVAACEVFATIECVSSVARLLQLADDPEAQVVQAAQEAVAAQGVAALPVLLDHLDARETIQRAVNEALSRLDGEAVPALLEVLPQGPPERQAAAVSVLQQMRAEEAVEAVLDLLIAPEPAGNAARAFVVSWPEACLLGLIERLCGENALLRTAAANSCVEIGHAAVPALAGVAGAGSDDGRIAALEALGEIGGSQALDTVIAATRHASEGIRATAARALGVMRAEGGLETLCRMAEDPEAVVRSAVADALACFGDEGMSVLVKYFHLDELALSVELLDTLRVMDAAGRSNLADLVLANEAEMRAGAVNALVALEHEQVLDLLVPLLADSHPAVCKAVRGAVQQFGSASISLCLTGLASSSDAGAVTAQECLLLLGDRTLDPVIEFLMDRTNTWRSRAIPVLAGLYAPQGVEALLLTMSEGTGGLFDEAATAVINFGAQAISSIIPYLDDADPGMRHAVMHVLNRLGDIARPAIVDVLAEGTKSQKTVALWVLADLSAVEAAPLAVDYIAEDGELGEAACYFMLLDPDTAVPLLAQRLGDPVKALRNKAAQLLVQIGLPAVVELGSALLGESREMRLAATGALGEIGGHEAELALALAATDPDVDVRVAAVNALGNMKALQTVAHSLQDNDKTVVAAALHALAQEPQVGLVAVFEECLQQLGPFSEGLLSALRQFAEQTVIYLKEQLQSEDALHRATACYCLATLEVEACYPALVKLLGDEAESVVEAAYTSLTGLGVAVIGVLIAEVTAATTDIRDKTTDCLVAIGEPTVSSLIDTVLDRTTPDRGAAIAALTRLQPEGITEHLLAWLVDGDELVRAAAAQGLATLHYEPALPMLLDGIDQDSDISREARLEAICSFGDVAVPLLIERMGDPVWANSPALARALASLGSIIEETILEMLDHAEARRRLLAARTLQSMKLEHAVDKLLAHVTDSDEQVREAIAIALAQLPAIHALPLLKNLITAGPDTQGYYADAIVLQGAELIDELTLLLIDDSPAVQTIAVGVLSRVARPGDIDDVAALLGSSDDDVRIATCHALANYPQVRSAEVLLNVLNDVNPDVIEAASEALGALGDLAFEVLVPRLVGENGEVDPQVVRALSRAGAGAEPILRDCLTRETPNVRAAAAQALCILVGEKAIDAIAPLLGDENEQVRHTVIDSLVEFGPAAGNVSLEILLGGQQPAAFTAAEVLGQVGAHLVEDIISALRVPAPRARAAAAWALGKIGDVQAGTHLVIRLKDPEASVRVVASMALGMLGWTKAVPHLISVLEDEDVRVSTAAIGALAQIGPPAIEGLVSRIVAPNGTIRDEVVYALSAIGDQALPPLLRITENANDVIRLAVLRVLAMVGSETTIEPLIAALFEPNQDMRNEAVRGLRNVGHAAVPELIRRLKNSTGAAQAPLVEALAALKEAAITNVVQLFDEPEERLWIAASDILGQMGSTAVPTLRRVLEHENTAVRAMAVTAIAQAGEAAVVPDILELINDEQEAVQAAVIRALANMEDPRGIVPITRCFGRSGWKIAEALDFALDRLAKQLAGPLSDLIAIENQETVDAVHKALLKLEHIAEEPLLNKLNKGTGKEAAVAAQLLGKLGSLSAVLPLVEHLGASNALLREAVCEALIELGPAVLTPVLDRLPENNATVSDSILKIMQGLPGEPVFALMERARDADSSKRLAAIVMAGRYGHIEALPTLIQRLQDTSLEINIASIRAISLIGDPGGIIKLVDLVNSPNKELVTVVREVLCAHASVALEPLVRRILHTDDEEAPEFTAMALEVAHHVPDEIAQLLEHPEEKVRRGAALVVGAMGNNEALRLLVQKTRNADPAVRQDAVRALGRMGEAAIRPLGELLNDSEITIRRSAAEVLASMGGLGLRPLLVALGQPADAGLRNLICEVLAEKHIAEARDALRKVCHQDTDELVRVAAAAALLAIGDSQGDELLEASLQSSNAKIRAQAVKALMQGNQRNLGRILGLVDDKNEEVRAAALQALRTASQDQVPLVMQFVQHPDPEVRITVAQALNKAAGDAAALQVLLTLVHDDVQTVCDTAAESLTAFGDQALQALGKQLQTGTPEQQQSACWALGQLGAGAVPLLLNAEGIADLRLLAELVRSLGRIGDIRGRDLVLNALNHENTRVRVAAVRAMRRLAQPQDAVLIANCLADSDSNVRMVAVTVIGGIMTDELRTHAQQLLRHEEPNTRAAAAQVLQQDAHPSSLKLLKYALTKETETWVAELLESAIEASDM